MFKAPVCTFIYVWLVHLVVSTQLQWQLAWTDKKYSLWIFNCARSMHLSRLPHTHSHTCTHTTESGSACVCVCVCGGRGFWVGLLRLHICGSLGSFRFSKCAFSLQFVVCISLGSWSLLSVVLFFCAVSCCCLSFYTKNLATV